jgi:hypothetical protein
VTHESLATRRLRPTACLRKLHSARQTVGLTACETRSVCGELKVVSLSFHHDQWHACASGPIHSPPLPLPGDRLGRLRDCQCLLPRRPPLTRPSHEPTIGSVRKAPRSRAGEGHQHRHAQGPHVSPVGIDQHRSIRAASVPGQPHHLLVPGGEDKGEDMRLCMAQCRVWYNCSTWVHWQKI